MDLPVRVIRRDLVPRCGPLGGVLTALQTTKSAAVLLLTCDMPLVELGLLQRLIRVSRQGTRPVFVQSERGWGFPALLPKDCLAGVSELHEQGRHSMQQLAGSLKAHPLRRKACAPELFNVNTPEDWEEAKRLLAARHPAADGLGWSQDGCRH